ncbi:hypothetical protein TNCV_1873141 [Trichonephila clavipes]|nr:hypothetical protein TNCV_1873141 [Trichonephila clavipes]
MPDAETFDIKVLMEIYNRSTNNDGYRHAYITCASTEVEFFNFIPRLCRGWKTHRQIFRLCRGWRWKPIDENPPCVEVEPQFSVNNPPVQRPELQFQLYYPRRVLCKKANGAMKTSSVEFISRSPNPLPMKSKHHRFVLFEGFSSPGSGNEGKREIVLNRRPELYRGKYRCVQPKINLLKKMFLCRPCLFRFFLYVSDSSGLHGNAAADSVRSEWPLWHAAKTKTVFARRRIKVKAELKLKKKRLLRKTLREKKERRTREVREQALPSEYNRQTYL